MGMIPWPETKYRIQVLKDGSFAPSYRLWFWPTWYWCGRLGTYDTIPSRWSAAYEAMQHIKAHKRYRATPEVTVWQGK